MHKTADGVYIMNETTEELKTLVLRLWHEHRGVAGCLAAAEQQGLRGAYATPRSWILGLARLAFGAQDGFDVLKLGGESA